MQSAAPVAVLYRDVCGSIQDGDLLLFRGQGVCARLISIAGRSPYTHAGLAVRAWVIDPQQIDQVPVLLCAEMRELAGGRAVTLASQVARFPGQIDVFTVRDEYSEHYARQLAASGMLRRAGHAYSYRGLAKAALVHLPVVRWFASPETDDQINGHGPLFCSHAVAVEARARGGVDPVPNLADKITEPGDLARSRLWEPRWTLHPGEDLPGW